MTLTMMGDFETTVFPGQEYTEVWAAAVVPFYTEDVSIFHSIDECWNYLVNLRQSILIYFHNLKFDGTFWLDYFVNKTKLKQAYWKDEAGVYTWYDESKMPTNSYKYSISDAGEWYNIVIKLSNRKIEIRDSLKLLPFSVKRIGQSFKTKHQKLDMEYTGYRYAGCRITEEEQRYIKNDVLVVKEALELMYDQGHSEMTIGACCLQEFRRGFESRDYKILFPNLYAIKIDKDVYGSETAGEYINRSYRGGWCYLVKGKENRYFRNGTTADVNSLYPSMMHSMSGNFYPWGKPVFFTGEIPEKAKREHMYYFVRIRTRFRIKPGMLPFIQIKDNVIYRATEALETSDFKSRKDGRYYRYYRTRDGVKHDTFVTLTLTMTDYELILKHYDLIDCEVLDGCYFQALTGLFDDYIEKYKRLKQTSTGALKALYKLLLNNLYGKLAANNNSSFKVAEQGQNGLRYVIQPEYDKKPGYIACGSAITSYARRFTITAAQLNYHGPDQPGFIYADTDSIHCDLPADQIVGAPQHDTEFCHWKYESTWDYGWFVRQKTYIEHVTEENLKPVEKPFYNVRCAGMPEKCKDLFLRSVSQDYSPEDYTEEELSFLETKREIHDFTIGLAVPGKLIPKIIPGGCLLTETTYEMR